MSQVDDPIASGAWLQDDFEHAKLTIAELRRLFLEHNVEFKGGAKKPELVRLFEQELKPKLAQIRRRLAATPEKSTNPIEEVGRADTVSPTKRGPGRPRKSVAPDTPATVKRGPGRPRKNPIDDGGAPPTTATKRKRTKKSAEDATATETEAETADEDVKQLIESPTKKRSRKPTVKARAPETDDTADDSETPAPRSTKRKSAAADAESPKKVKTASPRKSRAVKVEVAEPESEPEPAAKIETPIAKEAKHSRFSTDNPFQSGSTPTSSKRRHTAVPTSEQKLPPPEKTPRRKSEYVPAVESDTERKTPLRNKFMPAVGQMRASPAFQSAAQRRFENDAMADQLTKSPQREVVAVGPAVEPTSQQLSIQRIVKNAAVFTLFAALSLGATQWRVEKVRAGYCGVDSRPRHLAITAPLSDKIAHWVLPECEPCPAHGTCLPGFQVQCDDGFVPVQHPFSLGGLVPMAPACLPDTEKLRKIQIVAEEAVQQLRDQNAAFECGHSESATLTESELHNALRARKSASLTDDQFDSLFEHAVEDVQSRDEIIHQDGSYRSTSLANVGIVCAIRRSARQGLARYRAPIAAILALLLASLFVRAAYSQREHDKRRLVEMVARCFDELSLAKRRSLTTSGGGKSEPFLGVSQLRDGILRNDFSQSSREKLWRKVAAVVEGNSNVRATQAEIEGEWLRAWEWIGPARPMTEIEIRREKGILDGDDFAKPLF